MIKMFCFNNIVACVVNIYDTISMAAECIGLDSGYQLICDLENIKYTKIYYCKYTNCWRNILINYFNSLLIIIFINL